MPGNTFGSRAHTNVRVSLCRWVSLEIHENIGPCGGSWGLNWETQFRYTLHDKVVGLQSQWVLDGGLTTKPVGKET